MQMHSQSIGVGNVAMRYLVILIYLYQMSVVVALEGCGNIETVIPSESSLVPNNYSHEWNRELYHQVLSCQGNLSCKAVTNTIIGIVGAVCSATPGLMQPAEVYIVRRDSDIPGNIKIFSSL